jgi:hypothetical protein
MKILRKLILPVLIIGAVALFLTSDLVPRISDMVRAIGYEPSSTVSEVSGRIALTERGELILRASRAEVLGQDEFNAKCVNESFEGLSVLGCYANGKVYVYSVDHPELFGIEETTMAHELLHAVWARMGESEKSRIAGYLEAVYAENTVALDENLKNYSEAARADELHARVGTEISELPAELEKHYAKYFVDRSQVVVYFNMYHGKFVDLKAESERLKGEIDFLKGEIDRLQAEYSSGVADLNRRIAEFDDRLKTGYFTSQAQFDRERKALLSETDRMNDLYAEIDETVSSHNELVEEYNENVIHLIDLSDAMNSATGVPEV